MSGEGPGFVSLRVFDWQRAIAAAPELTDKQRATAMLFAHRGKALTGQDVTIDWAQLAQVRSCSTDTVERLARKLLELGYLYQTKRAAPGRAAHFELRGPAEFAGSAKKQRRANAPHSTRASEGRDAPQPTRGSAGRDAPQPTRGSAGRDQRSAESGGNVPQLPAQSAEPNQEKQETPSPYPLRRDEQAIALIAEEDGCTPDEARALLTYARNDKTTRWSARSRVADPEYRAQVRRRWAAEQQAEQRAQVACPHGVPQGRKITGKGPDASRVCPQCQLEDEAATRAEHGPLLWSGQPDHNGAASGRAEQTTTGRSRSAR